LQPLKKRRVVIVGGGFGGLTAAQSFHGQAMDVVLIDRTNQHLLYQVATAALSAGDIASPLRTILQSQRNVRILMNEVVAVDRAKQVVRLRDTEVPFDYLILAPGSRHSYFGTEQWGTFAPGLKTLVDALSIREHMLLSFEHAERVKETPAAHGVDVRLNTRVTEVNERGVSAGGQFIETANAIWAAGNEASPLLRTLGLPLDQQGRVAVDTDLSIPGNPLYLRHRRCRESDRYGRATAARSSACRHSAGALRGRPYRQRDSFGSPSPVRLQGPRNARYNRESSCDCADWAIAHGGSAGMAALVCGPHFLPDRVP